MRKIYVHRGITLLIAFVMVISLFSSCSQAPQESAQQTASQSSEAQQSPVQSEAAPEAEPQDNKMTPLSEELVTLTMYFPWSPRMVTLGYDTPNDFLFYPELENRTNVHIDFTCVNAEMAKEMFLLMISAGETTDLLSMSLHYYDGGAQKAIDDEIVYDLTDLVNQYAPNYAALRESEPQFAKDSATDKGALAQFCRWAPEATVTQGDQIRLDWLEAVNMDKPITYDDWHDVLTAFKTELDVETPFIGGPNLFDLPMHGFDISYKAQDIGYFFQVDGTVKCTFTEPGYKEWMELAHQWYTEGLISADWVAGTIKNSDMHAIVARGEAGIWYSDVDRMVALANESDDENFLAGPISTPLQYEGQVTHLRFVEQKCGMGVAITTKCSDPELATKWLDYWYSEDGSLLANYGIEGTSFEYNSAGEPVFTDLVANDENGLNIAMFKYAVDWGPFVIDWNRKNAVYTEEQLEAIELWNGPYDWGYSAFTTMTAEEAERYNALWGDISTYVSEMAPRFILGEISFDEYDAFLDTLINTLSINEAIQIKQDALDRYYAR